MLPELIICRCCREAVEAESTDLGQVKVACDCGRTSFYSIGDHYEDGVDGKWRVLAAEDLQPVA